VNAFVKLTSCFDNDFEYNLQFTAKQIRDDKATAQAYLRKTSDVWSAGDDRYAY
jgi:hypothetical protein